jgi:large subunit ribosomal protein L10
MTKADKTAVIEELKGKLADSEFFYITDSSTLTVENVNKLRGMLFEKGIEMRVVKNTLLRKAMEATADEKGFEPLYEHLKGPTSVMFTDVANAPAKVIKEFRKSSPKPVIKAAYIDSAIYEGDERLDELASIKSNEELLGDLLGLLQSPMRNLVGSLQSGQSTIMNLLKALEQREEA